MYLDFWDANKFSYVVVQYTIVPRNANNSSHQRQVELCALPISRRTDSISKQAREGDCRRLGFTGWGRCFRLPRQRASFYQKTPQQFLRSCSSREKMRTPTLKRRKRYRHWWLNWQYRPQIVLSHHRSHHCLYHLQHIGPTDGHVAVAIRPLYA